MWLVSVYIYICIYGYKIENIEKKMIKNEENEEKKKKKEEKDGYFACRGCGCALYMADNKVQLPRTCGWLVFIYIYIYIYK